MLKTGRGTKMNAENRQRNSEGKTDSPGSYPRQVVTVMTNMLKRRENIREGK